jgi:hypothetical protein
MTKEDNRTKRPQRQHSEPFCDAFCNGLSVDEFLCGTKVEPKPDDVKLRYRIHWSVTCFILLFQISERRFLKEMEKSAPHPLGGSLTTGRAEQSGEERDTLQQKAAYRKLLDEQVRSSFCHV